MPDAMQRLLDSLQQRRPFESKQQAAALAILRAADVIRRYTGQIMEPYGITMQQYNVLRILRGAETGLATLSIGERLIEQTPGMTRLIDRLESKSLVERRRCADDRRQVLCFVTETGRDLLAKLEDPVRGISVHLLGQISDDEAEMLLELLARVWEHPCSKARPASN